MTNTVLQTHMLLPIDEIARKLALLPTEYEPIGTYGAKLKRFAEWGYDRLPVCIAKTQYSLTDNPKLMGAPKSWMLHANDASLSAGAGFVVAVAGNMMLMPGLPREPRALAIDVDTDGNIVGM